MISDTERREVARRLRKAIGLTEFAEVLGFNWTDDSDWVWNDVSNLVADLIEPSEPEGTCGNCKNFIKDRFMPCAAAHGYTEADVSACEDFIPLSCDRDALLELADELDENAEIIIRVARNPRLTGCGPTMEEARHDAHEWRQIACRIREALGVER